MIKWRFTKKRSLVIAAIFMIAFYGMVMASSGEHESHDSHDAHAEKTWVSTDTYRVMNFLVLVVALFLLLKKPASQALNSRISEIKNELETLESEKSTAEKKLAEYNQKFSALENEAKQLLDDYIKQGESAKQRIIDEAKQTAEKMQAQAKKNIEQEFSLAKKDLQEEIMDKAIALAENIIKNNITNEDQDRLIGEFTEKVVA
jgi:F-type H+-transporting ATPase subunit b